MRKAIRITLFLVVSVIIYFLLRNIFPKNTGVLTFFLFYLLSDLYLWAWVKKHSFHLKRSWKLITSLLFWIPVFLLGAMVVYGFFYPFLEWNLYIKTYGISLFLCFFFCTLFPILFLLAGDVIRLLQWIILRLAHRDSPGKKNKLWRTDLLVTAGWFIGGIFFFILLGGMIFWQYDFRVREKEIILPDLPERFDGIRIVQFSDLHLGNWPRKDKLEEVIRMINASRPDIIFFTGDMFNYCTAEGYEFIPILKRLHAPLGIYTILGNHDYGEYIRWPSREAKAANMEALVRFYRSLGWTLLRNEHRILTKGNDSIVLAGVENWGKTRRFQRLGDIAKALKGSEKQKIHLLLSHDPSYWEYVISRNFPEVTLTFSGHTHGGQVGINLWGIHWSPVVWFSTFWGGLYQKNTTAGSQYLYVDEGLGCIGYSGRVGILPEFTLFVLRR